MYIPLPSSYIKYPYSNIKFFQQKKNNHLFDVYL